jgi:hypothetical protein
MFPAMVEPHDGFVFEPQKIGNEWQFRVHCPGAEVSYIHGFASKAQALDWLAGVGRPSWIKGWNEAA